MTSAPTWHDGERLLQSRAGMAARLAEVGPLVIRDHMPEQHRQFFEQLPFLVVGSVDAHGQPWTSVLAAAPGFARAPDPRHLRIDALPSEGDPLRAGLVANASIGLLGIEPHTRRRNRMNGIVAQVDAHGFAVEVQQSFGNCPRYIQAREAVFMDRGPGLQPSSRTGPMDAEARRTISAADTFFIATAHPEADDGSRSHGVDVSHRGGPAGFVRFEGDDVLLVPDFAGNNFFNTLGNIVLNPRAGLLFIDFETGDLLQLAVAAEIVFEGPELASFAGAQRLLRMRVLAARHAPGALPLRWDSFSLPLRGRVGVGAVPGAADPHPSPPPEGEGARPSR